MIDLISSSFVLLYTVLSRPPYSVLFLLSYSTWGDWWIWLDLYAAILSEEMIVYL